MCIKLWRPVHGDAVGLGGSSTLSGHGLGHGDRYAADIASPRCIRGYGDYGAAGSIVTVKDGLWDDSPATLATVLVIV